MSDIIPQNMRYRVPFFVNSAQNVHFSARVCYTIRMAKAYYDQRNIDNTARLREVLKTLPDYAEEFGFEPVFLPVERLFNWLEASKDKDFQYVFLMMIGDYKPMLNAEYLKRLGEILAKTRKASDVNVRYASYVATLELYDTPKNQIEIWLRDVDEARNLSLADKEFLRSMLLQQKGEE